LFISSKSQVWTLFEGSLPRGSLAPQEGQIEIHCIDTWEGGLENQQGGIAPADMSGVEKRFCSNTELALAAKAPAEVKLVRHKDFSYKALARLLDNGKEGF
jgi:hypothetical protein